MRLAWVAAIAGCCAWAAHGQTPSPQSILDAATKVGFRTLLVGNICIDQIPAAAFVEGAELGKLPQGVIRDFSIEHLPAAGDATKPRVFVVSPERVRDSLFSQSQPPAQGVLVAQAGGIPMDLPFQAWPPAMGSKKPTVPLADLLKDMQKNELRDRLQDWITKPPKLVPPASTQPCPVLLSEASTDAAFSLAIEPPGGLGRRVLQYAGTVTRLQVKGRHVTIPMTFPQPRIHNGVTLPEGLWAPGRAEQTAYLVAPGALRVETGGQLTAHVKETDIDQAAREKMQQDLFGAFHVPGPVVQPGVLVAPGTQKPALVILPVQHKLFVDAPLLGGRLSQEPGTHGVITNITTLFTATREIDEAWRSHDPALPGVFAPERLHLALSTASLNGIRIFATQSAPAVHGYRSDGQVVVEIGLSDGSFRLWSGAFRLQQDSLRSWTDPFISLDRVHLANVELAVEDMRLTATEGALGIRFEGLKAKARAIAWDDLSLGGIDATITAQSVSASLLLDRGGAFQMRESTWKSVAFEAAQFGIGLPGFGQVSGQAKGTAQSIGSSHIEDGHIILKLTRAGLGPLAGIALLADGAEVPFQLRASGTTSNLRVRLIWPGTALPLPGLDVVPIQPVTLADFTMSLGASELRIPIDLRLEPSSGELAIGAGGSTRLKGALDRFELRGELLIGRQGTRLLVPPGGLEVRIAGAVSTTPWLAGGIPSFAGAFVDVSTAHGFVIGGGATHGGLLIGADVININDPKVELLTGIPAVIASPPLRLAAGARVKMELPSGRVKVVSGSLRLVGPVQARTEKDLRASIGKLRLKNAAVILQGVTADFKEDGTASASMTGLSVSAERMENGGQDGVIDEDAATYWAASLAQPFLLESAAAKGKLDNDKFQLEDGEVIGLSLPITRAEFQSRDGMRYQATATTLSIREASPRKLDASFVLSGGLIESSQEPKYTVPVSEVRIDVGGAPKKEGARIRMSISGLDARAQSRHDIGKTCDQGGSPVLESEVVVKSGPFIADIRVDTEGTSRGRGRLSSPSARVAVAENFICRWSDKVSRDYNWCPFGKSDICSGTVTVETVQSVRVAHARFGYGFDRAELVFRKGRPHICLAGASLVEPGTALLSGSIVPKTKVDQLDALLSDAMNVVLAPFLSGLTISLVNAAGILASGAGWLAEATGSNCWEVQ